MAIFPEPAWAAEGQGVDTDPHNSLCFEYNPYYLTGFFVQVARAHFITSSNIVFPSLKGYLWSEDAALSKVLIEPSYMVNLKNVQQRPAILVKRSDLSMGYPGLGDGRHMPHFEGEGPMAGYQLGIDFTSIMSCGHEIICVGMTGAEAELLGWEVFLKYATHKEILKREARVGKFIVSGLSSVKKLDENQENWAVTIQLGWKSTLEWTVKQDSPTLKKIVNNSSLI